MAKESVFKSNNSIMVTTQDDCNYISIVPTSFMFPITKINIDQIVDCNVHKALDNSIAVSNFGSKPIAITISGIVAATSSLSLICTSIASLSQLQKFYNENKTKQIKVTIQGTTYTCILLSMNLNNNQQYPGILLYTLKLVGVKDTI